VIYFEPGVTICLHVGREKDGQWLVYVLFKDVSSQVEEWQTRGKHLADHERKCNATWIQHGSRDIDAMIFSANDGMASDSYDLFAEKCTLSY